MEDGTKGGEEGEEKEKKESNVTTLDSLQAMCLPLGASFSLLIMFFFFDSMQLLFAVCTAVIATVALAFLLLPMCQYLVRPCTNKVTIIFWRIKIFLSSKVIKCCSVQGKIPLKCAGGLRWLSCCR